MVEMVILSLIVGSLGIESLMISRWLKSQIKAQIQEEEEEEEILTRYESTDDNQDLKQALTVNGKPKPLTKDAHLMGWEFKIVRASRNLFRHPATFHRLCQEEAEQGWILLEKLDDHRVRFKRPVAMRDLFKSEVPRFDPYRTHYGSESHGWLWLGGLAFMIAMILPAFLGYILVSQHLNSSPISGEIPGLKSSPHSESTETK